MHTSKTICTLFIVPGIISLMQFNMGLVDLWTSNEVLVGSNSRNSSYGEFIMNTPPFAFGCNCQFGYSVIIARDSC